MTVDGGPPRILRRRRRAGAPSSLQLERQILRPPVRTVELLVHLRGGVSHARVRAECRGWLVDEAKPDLRRAIALAIHARRVEIRHEPRRADDLRPPHAWRGLRRSGVGGLSLIVLAAAHE